MNSRNWQYIGSFKQRRISFFCWREPWLILNIFESDQIAISITVGSNHFYILVDWVNGTIIWKFYKLDILSGSNNIGSKYIDRKNWEYYKEMERMKIIQILIKKKVNASCPENNTHESITIVQKVTT